MAFSAQPQLNSHKVDYLSFAVKQPFRTPQGFATSANLQESITTPRVVNFIRETDGQKSWLRARPGLVTGTTPSYIPGNAYRVKTYSDSAGNTRTIIAEGTNIYLDGVAIVTGGGTNAYFDVFKYLSGQEAIFITSSAGARLYNITTSTLTVVTDPHFPVGSNYPVVLDNYVFVAAPNGDIYQCDFDNPLSWTPGNFITADLTPGNIFFMGRTQNYITVFKTGGVEFFYNAGNPSGSVLAQYESFFKQLNVFRFQIPILYNDSWYFLGSGSNSKQGIYSITTSSLEIILDLAEFQYSLPQSSSATNYLAIFELAGKPFLQVPTRAPNASTFMFYVDILDKDVVHFDFGNVNSLNHFSITYFVDGVWFFHADGQATILQYDSKNTPLFQDYGQNIRYAVYTGKIDHGTSFLKTCSRLLFDLEPYNSTGNPTITVQWATRDITAISAPIATLPFTYSSTQANQASRSSLTLNRLGRYRYRFYRFNFTGASFKLNGVSFDLDVGTN